MASFTYRLENGDPAPTPVLDAIQARHARLQDLVQAVERLAGAVAAREDWDALHRVQAEVIEALATMRDADKELERVAAEANRAGGWRSIDLRKATSEPAE
jgi:hypothetical protein